MGNCRSRAIEVIPDKTTMLHIVDTIVQFEEMLKRGEQPSKKDKKEIARCAGVAREMKRLVKTQNE